MTFEYDKINAKCKWYKRTQNPHPYFSKETISTKIFKSKKGRKIELCFSCFEQEKKSFDNAVFKENLDNKYEAMKLFNL